MKKLEKYYWWLIIVNLLAIMATIYLVDLHYKPELSDICTFGQRWNCDIVNKSTYSTFFGIPVAIMGLVAYLSFLIFSIRGLFRDQTKLIPYFLFFVAGGTAFALYLTGIETFVLKTYCILCVAQQILILIELGIAAKLYKLTKRHEKTT